MRLLDECTAGSQATISKAGSQLAAGNAIDDGRVTLPAFTLTLLLLMRRELQSYPIHIHAPYLSRFDPPTTQTLHLAFGSIHYRVTSPHRSMAQGATNTSTTKRICTIQSYRPHLH